MRIANPPDNFSLISDFETKIYLRLVCESVNAVEGEPNRGSQQGLMPANGWLLRQEANRKSLD